MTADQWMDLLREVARDARLTRTDERVLLSRYVLDAEGNRLPESEQVETVAARVGLKARTVLDSTKRLARFGWIVDGRLLGELGKAAAS